jgi:hypothetical protein
MRLEIDYDLGSEEAYDLLTEALDGGSIDYWSETTSSLRDSHNKVFEWVIVDEDENKHTLSSSSIERGIKRMFKSDFKIDNDILRRVIAKEFDDECYDAIIQAALFGQLLYG